MMNFMAFYNPKYIIGVTIGCMIANFFSFGLLDVFVGGGSTLVFLSLGVWLFAKYSKDYLFNGLIRKDHFFFSILFSIFYVYYSCRVEYRSAITIFPYLVYNRDWGILPL